MNTFKKLFIKLKLLLVGLEAPQNDEEQKIEIDFPISIVGIQNKSQTKIKSLPEMHISYLTKNMNTDKSNQTTEWLS